MKNIRIFLSEKFPFLVVKFSIYLNRRVSVIGLNSYSLLSVAQPLVLTIGVQANVACCR